jgi:hypothetical protein
VVFVARLLVARENFHRVGGGSLGHDGEDYNGAHAMTIGTALAASR